MKKVKIIGGFNSDLIGKEATVVNEQSDGMIEVIVKGRESMRYTIPANTTQVLNQPVFEKVQNVEKSVEPLKANLQKLIVDTERFLNELKEMYANYK